MHFVAFKTVREYNRNQEKKEFLLTKKKHKQAQQKQPPADSNPEPSAHFDQHGPSSSTQWLKPSKNPRPQKPQKGKEQPRRNAQRQTKNSSNAQKRRRWHKTNWKKTKHRQRERLNSSRNQTDTTKLHNNKSVEVINLASDSSQGSPMTIFTSNDQGIFMNPPANKQRNSPARTNNNIDKIIQRITNSPTKRTAKTEQEQLITMIPASSSTPIGNNIINTSQQVNTEQTHSPEERQGTDAVKDNIHTEEGPADDVLATCSISSDSADIEALEKNSE